MTNTLPPADRELARTAFESSEDELLAALGEMLAGGSARDMEPQDLRARAEAWLRRNNKRLQAAVCAELPHLEDSLMDVATIADLLAATLSKPTAFTVAAILLKRGLRAWCLSG